MISYYSSSPCKVQSVGTREKAGGKREKGREVPTTHGTRRILRRTRLFVGGTDAHPAYKILSLGDQDTDVLHLSQCHCARYILNEPAVIVKSFGVQSSMQSFSIEAVFGTEGNYKWRMEYIWKKNPVFGRCKLVIYNCRSLYDIDQADGPNSSRHHVLTA